MSEVVNKTYWQHLREGISTSLTGLGLTWKHFWRAVFKKRRTTEGPASANYFTQDTSIVTLQYPNESMPVPDNGRYRLHNEIDDCIVCDKCAKVCPVDCIDIEAIKATEEIGKTSDGSSKRLYAAKFDIDMAKCCYCGLCTTVCPTECLTMTKSYDYSEFDIKNMIYHFSELTPEEAEKKRKAYEDHQAKKQQGASPKPGGAPQPAAKLPKVAVRPASPKPASGAKPKVVIKGIKPAQKKDTDNQ